MFNSPGLGRDPTYCEHYGDQASGLRQIFGPRPTSWLTVKGALSSAKGPVTVCVARALAQLGQRVLLIDQTRGEVAELLKLKTRYELYHVLLGDKALRDILLPTTIAGLHVLPAARGCKLLAEGNSAWTNELSELLLPERFDTIVINEADFSDTVSAPAKEGKLLLVVAPHSGAITQSYAEMKRVCYHYGSQLFHVLINGADETKARTIFANMESVARHTLGIKLNYCGALPKPPLSRMHTEQLDVLPVIERFAETLVDLPPPTRTAHAGRKKLSAATC